MTAKNVKFWYGSIVLMCLSVIPFFYFMAHLKVLTLLVSVVCIAVTAGIHMYATKRITHPQDKYTALQAMKFAEQCRNAGFRNSTVCKDRKEEFMQLVSSDDFMKDFDFQKALGVYQLGSQLQRELNIRKEMKG